MARARGARFLIKTLILQKKIVFLGFVSVACSTNTRWLLQKPAESFDVFCLFSKEIDVRRLPEADREIKEKQLLPDCQ